MGCGIIHIPRAVSYTHLASSSIITLVGFKLAAQPEDEDHPYGHARIEYLTGLFVSIFIIVIGLQLLKTSIDKILHPEPVEFSYLTVGMLVAAILIKLWQSLFNSSIGKKIKSVTLTATAAEDVYKRQVISFIPISRSSVKFDSS